MAERFIGKLAVCYVGRSIRKSSCFCSSVESKWHKQASGTYNALAKIKWQGPAHIRTNLHEARPPVALQWATRASLWHFLFSQKILASEIIELHTTHEAWFPLWERPYQYFWEITILSWQSPLHSMRYDSEPYVCGCVASQTKFPRAAASIAKTDPVLPSTVMWIQTCRDKQSESWNQLWTAGNLLKLCSFLCEAQPHRINSKSNASVFGIYVKTLEVQLRQTTLEVLNVQTQTHSQQVKTYSCTGTPCTSLLVH